MSEEPSFLPDTATPLDTSGARAVRTVKQPWVSRLAALGCVFVFFALTGDKQREAFESTLSWFYVPASSVWGGAYWTLVTSVFVHFEIWHLVFNVYWLWTLGRRMEQAVGSIAFLAFFVAVAFVSSAFELAVSDDMGIGASGVVYGIFGFMWQTRRHYREFKQVLDHRTIQVFLFWLVGCMIATIIGVWDVGNAAHLSGLLFGMVVAGAFVVRKRPVLMRTGLAAITTLAIVPLFWCPWSVDWLWHRAHAALEAGRLDESLALYSKVLRLDPEDANAYFNRSLVYEALGDEEKAEADLSKARELDPEIEEEE